MKNFFKTISVLLSLGTIISFTACGTPTNLDEESPSTSFEASMSNSNNETSLENASSNIENEQEVIEQEVIDQDPITGYLVVMDNLNVRESPDVDSQIIQTVPQSTILSMVRLLEDKWYKVAFRDGYAYVSAEYVKSISNEDYENFKVSRSFIELYGTTIEANLRILPDTEKGEIIRTLTSKDYFKVLGETNNNWYSVELPDGTTGYVSSELITTISKDEYEAITKTPKKLDPSKKDNLEKISSYTSDYSFSNENRRFNLERAADSISNMVIEPGSRFDWCRDMGPCGKDEGYKLSNVIMNGEYVKDYGGGICQVSSTLSAAISSCENGTFSIIERYKHGIPQSYVPLEYDATVSFPDCNFVFKNDNCFSVMIEAIYTEYCILTINLYKIND